MLRVAVRDALAHRLRLLATGTGIVLGVAFLAGSLVLTDTIRQTFDDLFAEVNAGHDAVLRQEFAIESPFEDDRRGRLDASLVDVVRATEGVAHAQGEVGGFAQIVGSDGEPLGSPGQGPPTLGVSWSSVDALSPLVLVEGHAPRDAGDAVIDRRSADVGDLEVGDPITILTKEGPARLTLVGIVRFGNSDSPGGASVTAFTPETAQRLVGEPGKFDQIAVVAADGVTPRQLVERLRRVVPSDIEVLTGGEFTEEEQGQIREAVGFFETFLLAFAGVGLFVGGFAIGNTFSVISAQRTKEMALLRAVGASRRQVLVSLVVEAALVGVVATAIGVAFGFLVAAGLKALLAGFGVDIPAAGLVFRARTAIAAVAVGVGVTVLSTIVPAWRASRVPPLAAIRDVSVDESGRSRFRLVAGAVVLSLGVFLAVGGRVLGLGGVAFGGPVAFIGIALLAASLVRPVGAVLGGPLPALRGMIGKLARENLVRNPRRTAATAMALMIGVGVVAAITILADSIKWSIRETVEENVRADFVVDPTTVGSGIATQLAERLRERPEIDVAVGVRDEFVKIDGRDEIVAAVDASRAAQVIDVGADEERLATLGRDEIAVHEDMARERGWEIGDRIDAVFADTGARRFTVALLYEEPFIVGSFFVDLSTFEANVVDQFDARVFVDAAAGIDASRARGVVESLAADFPNTEVRDLGEFREFQADQLNQLLGLVYSLLGLAIVIALLGIGNTLSLAVIERSRELGLLRAVGMTRRQLRSAVRWEALLVALFGTVLGLVAGLGFAAALTADTEGLLFRVPAGQVGAVALVAAGAGVLAAVVPARRAARLDILEAVAEH